MTDSTETTHETVARWAAEHGYALIKLPESVIDERGARAWPVESQDRCARVYRRLSDGRVVMDSVSHPFALPAHARSLAAALIAASAPATARSAVGSKEGQA